MSLQKIARVVDLVEETSIALCLGLMTLITFSNVVARYLFNANILWALELTVYLFAWLVLMGASYGVKKHLHIGVDIITNLLPPLPKRVVAAVALLACLCFAILLLIGSWDYWYPIATERAWLETDDIPLPAMFQFLSDWLNEGEPYEKVPRLIPYLALPLGLALLTWRFLQLGWKIARGEADAVIASHELVDTLQETTPESRIEPPER